MLAAQVPVPHIDTLRIVDVPVHHSSKGPDGPIQIVTPETMKMYDWDPAAGPNIIFMPDGSKYLEGSYRKRGSRMVPHGEFIIYNPDGSISRRGIYKHGKRRGIWSFNDESGLLTHTIDSKSGVRTVFHPNGNIKGQGKIRKARGTGNEFRVGHWQYYRENGQLHCEGRKKLWGNIGVWKIYDEAGTLKLCHYPRQLFATYRVLHREEEPALLCTCNSGTLSDDKD